MNLKKRLIKIETQVNPPVQKKVVHINNLSSYLVYIDGGYPSDVQVIVDKSFIADLRKMTQEVKEKIKKSNENKCLQS